MGDFALGVSHEFVVTCWPGLQSSESLTGVAWSAFKMIQKHSQQIGAGYSWQLSVPLQQASPQGMATGFPGKKLQEVKAEAAVSFMICSQFTHHYFYNVLLMMQVSPQNMGGDHTSA